MKSPVVISLGGSILVPDELNVAFLRRFVPFVRRMTRTRRVYLIAGGGATARRFVASAQRAGIHDATSLHWIGVRACQLNAAILISAFGLPGELVTDRTNVSRAKGRLVIVAPSVPGTTSDYGSVLIARAVGAGMIYNLTNVDGVYTADPRRVRSAKRITTLTWPAFQAMFVTKVKPGMHVPFDPAASRLAKRSGIKVTVLSSDLGNLSRAVSGKAFKGTVIGSS